MSTLNILVTIAAIVVFGLLFLLIRSLRIRFGLKDNNSGAVQHLRKLLPPPSAEDLFLPGSHMEVSGSDLLKQHINETPEIEILSPKKKRKRLFQSKQDILRAYIADTVLDKPKWKDNKKGGS
ncbi:MAG: hypothetical protein R8P61_19215 [Bacteroidia bacterium]|nr:hypothetical protein [Bacteroidia bacterium]